jgi:rRNA-processing protein FCF1
MFHVLVDTSFLFKAHFAHPDFQKLLLRSQEGKIKIHIPHIVLEEQRTRILAEIHEKLGRARKAFEDAKRTGAYEMFTQGLPDPHMLLWSDEDVDRRSKQVVQSFVDDNKIDVLSVSPDHAARAWTRYFGVAPPFNPQEPDRVKRREDIPDSWILEAALDLKARGGNLCALCGDGRLKSALKAEGFEIFDDAQALADRVDKALAVYPGVAISPSDKPLREQLRSAAFDGVDVAVLGFVDAFGTPAKERLFDLLEKAGFDRRVAEHVAQTLVLSGVLQDSGNYLLPTDRALAQRAAGEVEHLILKLLANDGS